jgi:hypothetical protein
MRHESREAEAARIRERLRAFRTAVSRAAALLRGGHPLIAATWYTAAAMRSRLGAGATPQDFLDLLLNPNVVISAAVDGWASSPATEELRAILDQLSLAQESLSGRLNLVSPAGDLLRKIADAEDAYSPVIFFNLLRGEPLAQFIQQNNHASDTKTLTRELAMYLQDGATAHFVKHYEPALQSIEVFVRTSAGVLGKLRSRTLVKLARARSRVDERTYCNDMRSELELLRRNLSDDDLLRLRELIHDIERLIS